MKYGGTGERVKLVMVKWGNEMGTDEGVRKEG